MEQSEKKFEKMLTVADLREYLSVTNGTSIAGSKEQACLLIVSGNAGCSTSLNLMMRG